MKKVNPTLQSIKKIEKEFSKGKAISRSYIENKLNMQFYTVTGVIDYLLNEKKIKSIKSSSNGVLYIKT